MIYDNDKTMAWPWYYSVQVTGDNTCTKHGYIASPPRSPQHLHALEPFWTEYFRVHICCSRPRPSASQHTHYHALPHRPTRYHTLPHVTTRYHAPSVTVIASHYHVQSVTVMTGHYHVPCVTVMASPYHAPSVTAMALPYHALSVKNTGST